ncbi:hypothetical protein HYH02_002051 [Chlamydomonas schloesseri]|uniref:Uncharacterized protein n=1 Tax=Chlamydomonas schloesseri TaxID=2026947 RepID=A0A835WUU0_9CHLO|nr:hypothetical protein HYH02_002051 [Chlamydomonas schloesseri]|eukprot:KAG2453844.1 hypothetical protein HYH02_002051 [Chlamydomonas schloesseri]
MTSDAEVLRLVILSRMHNRRDWHNVTSSASARRPQLRLTRHAAMPTAAACTAAPATRTAELLRLLPSASPSYALVSVHYKIHGAEPEQLTPGWARRLECAVLLGNGAVDPRPRHAHQDTWRQHGSQQLDSRPTCNSAVGSEERGQLGTLAASACRAGCASCVRLAGVCVRRGCVELTLDLLVALPQHHHAGHHTKAMGDGAAAGSSAAATGAPAAAAASAPAAGAAGWVDEIVPAVGRVVEALGLDGGGGVQQGEELVAAAATAAAAAASEVPGTAAAGSGTAGAGVRGAQQQEPAGSLASVLLPGTAVGDVEVRVRIVGGGPLRHPQQQQPGAQERHPQKQQQQKPQLQQQPGGMAPRAPRVVALQPRVLLLPACGASAAAAPLAAEVEGAPEPAERSGPPDEVLLRAVVARTRSHQPLRQSPRSEAQAQLQQEQEQEPLAPPSVLVRAHNRVLATRVVYFVRRDGGGGGGGGAVGGEDLYELCVAVQMPSRPGPVLAELEWQGCAAEVLPLAVLRDGGAGGAAAAAAAELDVLTAAVAEVCTASIKNGVPAQAAEAAATAGQDSAHATAAAAATATAAAAPQDSVLDSLLLDLAVWAQAEAEAAEAAARAVAATAAAPAEPEALLQPAPLPLRLPAAQLMYLGRHLLAFSQRVGLPATATWVARGLETLSASLVDSPAAPAATAASAAAMAGAASAAAAACGANAPAVVPPRCSGRASTGSESTADGASCKSHSVHSEPVGHERFGSGWAAHLRLWRHALKATLGLERASAEEEARLAAFAAPWAVAQEHFIHAVEVVGFLGMIARFAADGTLVQWGVAPFILGAVPGIASLCAWLVLPHAAWVRFVRDAKLLRYFFYLLVKTLVAGGLPVVTGQAQHYQGGLGVVMLEGVLMPLSCLLPLRTAAVVMTARVLPAAAVMLRTKVTNVPSEALIASIGVSAVAVLTTLSCHTYLRVSFIRHQRRQQQAQCAVIPQGGSTGGKGPQAGSLAAAAGSSSGTVCEGHKLKAE